LKWNENFTRPVVGDATFVVEEQRPGHFNDGRTHGYAFGLFVGTYKGLREVSHSGSTAGYSAFLTRFRDQKVSFAVLCNAVTNATDVAHKVADVYLAGSLAPPPVTTTYTLTAEDKTRLTGLYLNDKTNLALRIVDCGLRIADSHCGLRIENGPSLVPLDASLLVTMNGDRYTFDSHGGLTVVDSYGTTDRYERATPATPAAAALQAYAGVYESDEAETILIAKVDGDRLVLAQRPDRTLLLTPVATDLFRVRGLGAIRFRRDASGRVNELSVIQDRVWDLRFRKAATPGAQTTAGRP
jgi:hypothetical protein